MGLKYENNINSNNDNNLNNLKERGKSINYNFNTSKYNINYNSNIIGFYLGLFIAFYILFVFFIDILISFNYNTINNIYKENVNNQN